jgi:uncharacterized protein with HEPN domain
MSEREEILYLSDIDDALSAVLSYTREITFEEFARNRKTREAVILNVVVLGEAVRKLPPELTKRHPDIPWREFAGMREIIKQLPVSLSCMQHFGPDILPHLPAPTRYFYPPAAIMARVRHRMNVATTGGMNHGLLLRPFCIPRDPRPGL